MKLLVAGAMDSRSLYVCNTVKTEKGPRNVRFRALGPLKRLMEEMNLSEEEVIAWGKEQAKADTEKERQARAEHKALIALDTERAIEKDETRLFSGGYLFLQRILYSLGFSEICGGIRAGKEKNDAGDRRSYKYEYDFERILSDLVCARILYPSSKEGTYEETERFLLHSKPGGTAPYEQHDVYRALDVLAENDVFIQRKMYENSHFLVRRDNTVLYYDVTNYYFEIEQEKGSRRYGFSKENRPNPVVQMGLFADTDGIPLAFTVFDGKTNEQKSLKEIETRILEKFGCRRFIYCSDAGLASEANRVMNSVEDRHYVVTQSIRMLPEAERDEARDVRGFRYLKDGRLFDGEAFSDAGEMLYKEIPYTSKSLQQRMIVYYSPKYAAYARELRANRVARAEKKVSAGAHGRAYRGPVDRYTREMHVDPDGRIDYDFFLDLDQETIDEDATYDGLTAVCTDLFDETPARIRGINSGRWQIEQCFRTLKKDFKARPAYVALDSHIKAHFLTCFMSLVVLRLLERMLKYKYTEEDILKTLRDMRFLSTTDEFGNRGFMPAYTRTDLTDELHDLLGFRTDMEFTYESDMKKIVSLTKTPLRP